MQLPFYIEAAGITKSQDSDYRAILKQYKWTQHPFIDAVKNNNIEQLKAALLLDNYWVKPQFVSDINDNDTSGKTALEYAIEQSNNIMINILIGNGVDVNKKLSNKETPLEYAIKLNNRALVEILLYNNADSSSINVSNFRNNEIKALIEINQIQKKIKFLNSIKPLLNNKPDRYIRADFIEVDYYNKFITGMPEIAKFYKEDWEENGASQMHGSKQVYRRIGDDNTYKAAIQSKIDELYQQMPIKDNQNLAQLLPLLVNKKRVCINGTDMGVSISGKMCGTLAIGYPNPKQGKHAIPRSYYIDPEKIKTLMGGRRKLKRTRRNRRKNHKSKSRRQRV